MKNLERINKSLAAIFATGLGIGEAVMNWGNWQYAPLWIIDYIIVIWLLCGVFTKHREKSAIILISGWSFSIATMSMAAAFLTAPKYETVVEYSIVKLSLIILLIVVAVIGLILSYKLAIDKYKM